jgi:hypothetical protein
MIALILGGAPSVWRELAEAEALLGRRRRLVIAANLAGIHHVGKLDAWATLHPERLADWRAERKGPAAARYFVPAGLALAPWAEQAPDRWNGSSGLYAGQCALLEVGATAIVFCGVPMDSEAGHFVNPGAWAGTGDYRLGFEGALREAGGRIRSMGGWTADLFGHPTATWLAAVENIKPVGATAAHHLRITEMHKVTNTGKTQSSFWARDDTGQLVLHHLAPGESVDAEIDPNQRKFQGGDLKVTARHQASARAKPAPKKKAAAPKATPKKPVPPAEPASTEA